MNKIVNGLWISIFLVLVPFLFFVACSKNLRPYQPEAEGVSLHEIKVLASNGWVDIYEIDGCQYILIGQGGVVHKANCPNPEHSAEHKPVHGEKHELQ